MNRAKLLRDLRFDGIVTDLRFVPAGTEVLMYEPFTLDARMGHPDRVRVRLSDGTVTYLSPDDLEIIQ